MQMPKSTSSRRKRKRRSLRSRSSRTTDQPLAELGSSLTGGNRTEQLLLGGVDLGFGVLIVLLPFLMGGREGPGQFVLVLASCWTAVCWGLLQLRHAESRWTLSLAEPLLLAGVGLVVLQVLRLPQGMLERLSPRLGELLSHWQAGGSLPRWDQVSLMPGETIDSLMVLMSYVLIFVVAIQRIRSEQDSFRLMKALACTATLMAAFGLLQYATSNGRFFWFYENPFTDTDRVVKGAFTNRNHFASFLALGVGPLVWCLTSAAVRARSNDPAPQPTLLSPSSVMGLVVLATSVVVFGSLLSLSRGGAIALGVAFVVSGVTLYRSALVSGQLAAAAVCVVVTTCGLMAAYGEEQIQKRLDQIASVDVEQLDSHDGRRAIWAANIAGIREFPVAGTGVGSHREVYPIYMEDSGADYRNEFTHAENGYLQVGLETGVTGLCLLGACFLLALFWTFKGLGRHDRPMVTAAQAASLSGLLVSLVHSGADFVWYVPACVVPVILLAASACRLRQLQKAEKGSWVPQLPLPRLSWSVAAVGVMVLTIWMVPAKYRRMEAQQHWYRYLHMSLTAEDPAAQVRGSSLLRNRLIAVSRTIAADPTQARPHTRMAGLCLQAFHELQTASENPMSLAMIRNAAETNPWESREQMDAWLGRVFEERGEYLNKALAHTLKSLELCPLQGRAYLYLAELGFLDKSRDHQPTRLVDQAMLVRPHDPQVLFASGREKLLAGQGPAAVKLWKRAFGLSRKYQFAIISQMASVVTAEDLISTFEPDAEALAHTSERYRELGRAADMQYAMRAFTEACSTMAEDKTVPVDRSIRFLLAARKINDELGDTAGAQQCFVRASQLRPQEYRVHYQFGVWLAERQRYAEAAEEFRKCSSIRPGDDHARRLAVAMRRKQLDSQLSPGSRIAAQPGPEVF